uniref:Protein SDA1 n=1 Tax=Chenopodium quinoa TaxID=63459 RepID=A0A803KUU7_CHEQI
MKCDPESYEAELQTKYMDFKSSLEIFEQQAALSFNSVSGVSPDPSVAKELGDLALFLAHMTPFYPKFLSLYPKQLADLLRSTGKSLPSSLRSQLTQGLILLVNRKIVSIGETLELFMELQTFDDRNLRKLAYSHVIRFIQRMNKKHKDESKNKPLQNVLFKMLKREEEAFAKRALVTLCDLHRRKVWSDERTVNGICMACFHPSSRIMIAALSFLLDYEKIKDDDDSDASSSEDEACTLQPQVVLGREDVYKAHHKGTTASKKKKQAKLQRVMRSMKKKQRLSLEKTSPNYYSPLLQLNDAQGFAEKLFSRLQSCNERFEVPPDAVEPLFKQIVNQFVHDRSRTEAISVGLNVVREICLRMPLLMNEDLLQDLVMYKTSKEKAISSAARSLVTLFREICPSLLIKKDRGRSNNSKAKPKEYGEVNVAMGVPGSELLQSDEEDGDEDSDLNENCLSGSEDVEKDDADSLDYSGCEDDAKDEDSTESEEEDEDRTTFVEEGSEDEVSDADDIEDEEESCSSSEPDDSDVEGDNKKGARKRKYADLDQQLDTANSSLRALKKLTAAKLEHPSEADDHIYSNEDFKRIRDLQMKKQARSTLAQHGILKGTNPKSATIKIPSADQLCLKPLDPSTLEANIRRKMTKEQRVALMKAGREDREGYTSKAAVKQKKKGGLSNRQKEHKKFMPIAAKRGKIARSREDKRIKKMTSGKQFRGKKAWK